MGTDVENRKRPFGVTDPGPQGLEADETMQAGPSGAGKSRKVSSYRSASESRSGNSMPLSHRGYDQTGSSLPGSRTVSGSAPIHSAFLQQYVSQQPGPPSHTHSSFMVSRMHGSTVGFLSMGDVDENQRPETAGESGGDSEGHGGSEDDDDDNDDDDDDEGEDEEDEEEDDGEDDGGNNDDGASD